MVRASEDRELGRAVRSGLSGEQANRGSVSFVGYPPALMVERDWLGYTFFDASRKDYSATTSPLF